MAAIDHASNGSERRRASAHAGARRRRVLRRGRRDLRHDREPLEERRARAGRSPADERRDARRRAQARRRHRLGQRARGAVSHPTRGAWQIAVEFDQIDHALRAAIESAIASAVRAAKRRPILVIDDRASRRRDLVAQLSARGMSPLAPKTPLEAIDLLTRPQLHVGVCLLAPGFGHTADELRALLAHSFPWVTIETIADDLDDTIARAKQAWAATAVARLAGALS